MNTFIEIPANKSSIRQRKPIYGVGINDSPYLSEYINSDGKREVCKVYTTWNGVLGRCYSPDIQKKKPAYIGCTICDEWRLFSNFRRWMLSQEWEGMELDKDLLDPFSRVYSPGTCVFIPCSLNSLIKTRRKGDYKYPQGVNYHVSTGKYHARCSAYGSVKSLGLHDTPELASIAYRKFKSNNIKEVAQQYRSDPRLYKGLMSRAETLSL